MYGADVLLVAMLAALAWIVWLMVKSVEREAYDYRRIKPEYDRMTGFYADEDDVLPTPRRIAQERARMQTEIESAQERAEMQALREAMLKDIEGAKRVSRPMFIRDPLPVPVTEKKTDAQGRDHCEDGPAYFTEVAIAWNNSPTRDDPLGLGRFKTNPDTRVPVYCWHGVVVPEYVIMEPETITVWSIEREVNAEIRRVMIERYLGKTPETDQLDGYGRYIRDCGAMKIDEEAGIGILWRKEYTNDEPIVMVEVLNSTVEKDGTRHRFFLRVPPDTRTARQAVAWTFGLKARDYRPVAES